MMNLKTTLPLILIAMSVTCIQAQDVVNMLSCNDYKAVTFNDKTIEQINATNADPENIQDLFGNYSSDVLGGSTQHFNNCDPKEMILGKWEAEGNPGFIWHFYENSSLHFIITLLEKV